MELKQPWLAVDCVVFDEFDRLLLIRRRNPPFQHQFALPGGFLELGETTEEAALRELREETSVEAGNPQLVGVYSKPSRDPRRHVISVAYLVRVSGADAKAGDDAATAEFVRDWEHQSLAFDHDEIVRDARALMRGSTT